ncbi:phage tail assembly protein [Stenotrophomonas rhizophila]|uniref:phage tail assembly protein n=1 Tax=Stenotrophomonas rhizophila TaxID=216778 RepID=UPI001E48D7DD|nr:phage tail assembly protein [Stenotrophomonas rhizophila]MCC7632570.1 phage tail assembly protein [Stenotrophomonas rhizophila]MCC7663422.1 phage tail assembly protein [Stenotrophomonas rhizophila]
MSRKTPDTAVLDTSTGQVSAPDYTTIDLDSPITRGDQVIDRLQVRKPDAGSLRGVKLLDLLQMDVTAIRTLAPRITFPTLTTADVDKLDPADLVSLGTEIAGFFMKKADRESLNA